MWAVMVAKSWKSLEVQSNTPIALRFPTRMVQPGPDQPQWFIPVFATREAAEAWSEGQYPIWQIANMKEQEDVSE